MRPKTVGRKLQSPPPSTWLARYLASHRPELEQANRALRQRYGAISSPAKETTKPPAAARWYPSS